MYQKRLNFESFNTILTNYNEGFYCSEIQKYPSENTLLLLKWRKMIWKKPYQTGLGKVNCAKEVKDSLYYECITVRDTSVNIGTLMYFYLL